MENILVSIITVSFNSEKTISDTIESVLAQSYVNLEYIIIDGKSLDQTVTIAKEFEERFENKGISYKVISERDDGIYDAMNKGIKFSKGKIIGIINSDDWYEPNAIQIMVEKYRENKFDMFYADLRIIKENKTSVKHSKYRRYVTSRDWNHPTTFITKDIYNRFQYKNESIHDDWDMVLKIRKAGVKIEVCNQVLANFRVGGISNRKDIRLAIKRCKERYRIYRNNGYSRFYLLECIVMETAKFVFS